MNLSIANQWNMHLVVWKNDNIHYTKLKALKEGKLSLTREFRVFPHSQTKQIDCANWTEIGINGWYPPAIKHGNGKSRIYGWLYHSNLHFRGHGQLPCFLMTGAFFFCEIYPHIFTIYHEASSINRRVPMGPSWTIWLIGPNQRHNFGGTHGQA